MKSAQVNSAGGAALIDIRRVVKVFGGGARAFASRLPAQLSGGQQQMAE